MHVFAQSVNVTDARSHALALSIEATGQSYFGMSNPAGLATNTHLQIGMNYQNRFILYELGFMSVSTVIPVGKGTFAGRINYFGTASLYESGFALSYGHTISSWLAAGIDLNYHFLSVEALQEKRSAVTGNLGVLVIPTNELVFGIYYINPNNTKYGFRVGGENISSLQVGGSYAEVDKYLVACKINWTGFHWIDFAMGTEVNLGENIVVRGGIRLPSAPAYSFGAGMCYSSVQIDLSFDNHPVLGLSSSASVILKFNRHAGR